MDIVSEDLIQKISSNGSDIPVNSVQSLLFNPNESKLVSAYENGLISLWDIENGHKINDFVGHNGAVHSLAFNSDGSKLYSGGFDQFVRIWDFESGQLLAKLPGHNSRIVDIEYNSFQDQLISSSNNTIKIFTLDISELIKLAESRVVRSLTVEECQLYLRDEMCLND